MTGAAGRLTTASAMDRPLNDRLHAAGFAVTTRADQ